MTLFSRYLILVCLTLILSPLKASAEDIFEPPVRLKADGRVIDTGSSLGHSGPCFEDLDGDGLKDLLVGSFGGTFAIFRNIGTDEKPKFKQDGFVEAGGVRAEVRIYCCVGAQPRFCDLDGDGIRDMISSSYDPGSCYFFRGVSDHKFAAREELLDRSGVPVRAFPVQKEPVQSFGSFFTPVDWDADGDLDLLIGCFDGTLKLRVNDGDAKHYQFATENQTVTVVDGKPLSVNEHFCPAISDWDGDGMWDILAGSEEGSVTWFRNTGTKGKPRFEPGSVLIPAYDTSSGYTRLAISDDDGNVMPAGRVQIDVTDFNQDGKLDMIMGDFGLSYDLKPGLTDIQIRHAKQLRDDYVKTVTAYRERIAVARAEFEEKYPIDAAHTEEASADWENRVEAIRNGGPEWQQYQEADARFGKEMRPYIAKPRGEDNDAFDLQTPHGYVWLFQRK